jgi:hypothetical protein
MNKRWTTLRAYAKGKPPIEQRDRRTTMASGYMNAKWFDIENEYDELLLKKNRTADDERRIAEIEHYLFQQMTNRELSE